MANQRAFIGQGATFGTLDPAKGEFPATVQGLRDALNAGYRWLVVREDLVSFTSMLDLDAVTSFGRSLRIDGGAATGALGAGSTRFVRNFTTGPMIRCLTNLWSVQITGIQFEGSGSGGSHPLIELNRIEDSRFVDCSFVASKHHGVSVGDNGSGPIARRVVFEGCMFSENDQHGAYVDSAVLVSFHACRFLNNGKGPGSGSAGLYMRGPASNSADYANRGLGTVHDCWFETTASGDFGAWVHRSRAVDFARCTFVKAGVTLASDVDETWCERCRFQGGAGFQTLGGSDNYNVSDVVLT